MKTNEERKVKLMRQKLEEYSNELIHIAEFQTSLIEDIKGQGDETMKRVNKTRSAVVALLAELNTLDFDIMFKQLNSQIEKS